MRLSEQPSTALSDRVARVDYNRHGAAKQIVHLGMGAFHRAHQAVYTEDAIAATGEPWRIIGVSMRSASVRAQMAPQDHLFTVTTKGAGEPETRLVRCVTDVLVATDAPHDVVVAIADPRTHIVTLTVTEKGYEPPAALSLAAGDHQQGAAPQTIYHFIAQALKLRMDRGLEGLTFLSCDNVAENGKRLRQQLLDLLKTVDPKLAVWCERNCAFPCSMVDRIVPATQTADIDALEQQIGLRDEAAVFTEPFRQWVIERSFVGDRPNWEDAGAQIVSDVRAYETAKLRMLNGAHSALAYLGLAAGLTLVSEAIADPKIGPLVRSLMRDEAASSFTAAPEQDLAAYAASLETRFANPALPHRLAQIAMDGSQKIPQRWLATLADCQRQGKQCPAILEALAAWIVHVRGDNPHVSDPQAQMFASKWQQVGREGIASALFGAQSPFGEHWHPTAEDVKILQSHIDRLAI